MSRVVNLQLCIDCLSYKKGQIVSVHVDDKGIPLDRFWRSRLEDNCVLVCKETPKDLSSGVKKDKK
jgi:hypothetical protein